MRHYRMPYKQWSIGKKYPKKESNTSPQTSKSVIHPVRKCIKTSYENSTFVKKLKYKCKLCIFRDSRKDKMLKHLESHSGFPLSCRKCRKMFGNEEAYEFHSKHLCKLDETEKFKHRCAQCPQSFVLKQNLKKHLEGHKRNNCSYCSKVLTRRKHLIQHLVDVHSVKLERAVFDCSHCDKRYVKKRSLYYHLQHHFLDKFVCQQCGTITVNKNDFANHLLEHEKNKAFECARCKEKYSRRQQYVIHLKRHDLYKCITCNETYASKLKLLSHKQKGHTVEGLSKKYICTKCFKKFDQKSKFLLHMRRHTSDVKPNLFCQFCKISFQSPYAYYKHCTTKNHDKNAPSTSSFVCESCGGQFAKKYLLDIHILRVHKNSKELLSCYYCSYQTRNKTNMERHISLHFTTENKFTCEHCGKSFSNAASLKDHISYSHLQSKQFACDKCEKVFKRNSELVRHQAHHSDIRPHVCEHCNSSYKRLSHLKRHLKSAHNLEAPTRNTQRLRVQPDGSLLPVPPPEKAPPINETPLILQHEVVTLLEPINLVKVPQNVEPHQQIILQQSDAASYDFSDVQPVDFSTSSGLNYTAENFMQYSSQLEQVEMADDLSIGSYLRNQQVQEFYNIENWNYL